MLDTKTVRGYPISSYMSSVIVWKGVKYMVCERPMYLGQYCTLEAPGLPLYVRIWHAYHIEMPPRHHYGIRYFNQNEVQNSEILMNMDILVFSSKVMGKSKPCSIVIPQ